MRFDCVLVMVGEVDCSEQEMENGVSVGFREQVGFGEQETENVEGVIHVLVVARRLASLLQLVHDLDIVQVDRRSFHLSRQVD